MYKLNKKQKIIICVIALVVILIGYYFYTNKNNENIIEIEKKLMQTENVNSTDTFQEQEDIFVYISGAVNSPGVIKMKSDSRVKDVIEAAGGLKENADLKNINLAEKIEDEKKIYIPELGENNYEEINEDTNEQETSKLSVNINTANSTELQKLPGIGPSIADKIVEYRKQNGKFSNVEDIKNVSGIGEAKYQKIKDYIKVK